MILFVIQNLYDPFFPWHCLLFNVECFPFTFYSSINNLIGLLQSPHVEVRMACGEIIAVMLECGRMFDEDFMDMYLSDLIELTTDLAKDSQKFRAKKERKAQRASFRDVLRYLEVSLLNL